MNATESIELEILTRNEINRIAFCEIQNLLPQLIPFLNKKVFTQKGKAKTFNPTFLNTKPKPFKDGFAQVQHCYLDNDYSRLKLVIKLSYNGGSYETTPKTAYTQYIDKSIDIAELLHNQILVKIFDFDDVIISNGLNINLDIETELRYIAQYKQYQALADDAKRKINVTDNLYKFL